MSNILEFPPYPQPNEIYPPLKRSGINQYKWSAQDRVWRIYDQGFYAVVPHLAGVVEGDDLIFKVYTRGVSTGTVLDWSVLHISTSNEDFGGDVSGQITIVDSEAEITVSLLDDGIDDNLEQFRIELRTPDGDLVARSVDVTVFEQNKVYSVTPSVPSVSEGNAVTFYIETSNVVVPEDPFPVTLYWTLRGTVGSNYLTESDFVGGLSGSIELDVLGKAAQVIAIADDSDGLEGDELFFFELRETGVDGTIVSTSSVTILDVDPVSSISTLAATAISNPVAYNGEIEVTWSGSALSNRDWVGMYYPGQPNDKYLQYAYATGADQGTLSFSATHPPSVEFRYLPDNGFESIAKSNIIGIHHAPPLPAPYVPPVSAPTTTVSPTLYFAPQIQFASSYNQSIGKAGSGYDKWGWGRGTGQNSSYPSWDGTWWMNYSSGDKSRPVKCTITHVGTSSAVRFYLEENLVALGSSRESIKYFGSNVVGFKIGAQTQAGAATGTTVTLQVTFTSSYGGTTGSTHSFTVIFKVA